MATLHGDCKTADPDAVIREIEQAEGYIASICFKTGPPETVGVELEYTVHDRTTPASPVDRDRLTQALGDHAPGILRADSPGLPLRHGASVTLEPGGQVEISSRAHPSLTALHTAVNAELDQLNALLTPAGLGLGDSGVDPHRPPRRLLSTPRYDAMETAFDRLGISGKIMMCSTAGLQVCLDAGPPESLAARWAAVHELGPPLMALFANSRRFAGRDTGWASARQRAWHGIDPSRTRPVFAPGQDTVPGGSVPFGSIPFGSIPFGSVPFGSGSGPSRGGSAAGTHPRSGSTSDAGLDAAAADWARYALAATLLCVRSPAGPWTAPPGITFADWINGALSTFPTYDDLDYHLGTLFPPVRPRGYLEIRYLDTQPGRSWFAPAALLTALLADPATVDKARDLCAPAAGRWVEAARHGMTDPILAKVAPAVRDLALSRLDLPQDLLEEVIEGSSRNG